MLKTCQVCGRPFDGHPSARNCSIKCLQRHKHRRRKHRESSTPTQQTTAESPYEFIADNITAETLSTLFTNISLHIYPKDIRINGPIPSGVARPPDIILENLGDHHVLYHKSRQLVFP